MCSTMFRIDAQHLAWSLDNLVAGQVVNRIRVPAEVADPARLALERMLAIAR
jgi:quinolinate synthase